MHKHKDKETEQLVKERIGQLMDLAEKNQKERPERAVRYVGLARRLATRYRVRMPERFKRRICRICNRYWIPGYNVSVRLRRRDKVVEYRCVCGALRRFGYAKKGEKD